MDTHTEKKNRKLQIPTTQPPVDSFSAQSGIQSLLAKRGYTEDCMSGLSLLDEFLSLGYKPGLCNEVVY